MLYDGELCLATNDGNLSSIMLKTHINSPSTELKDQLKVLIELRKFHDALEVCKVINLPEEWEKLGKAAISDLEISFGNPIII